MQPELRPSPLAAGSAAAEIPTLRQAAEHFALTAQQLLQVCQDMQGELCRLPSVTAGRVDPSAGASSPSR